MMLDETLGRQGILEAGSLSSFAATGLKVLYLAEIVPILWF